MKTIPASLTSLLAAICLAASPAWAGAPVDISESDWQGIRAAYEAGNHAFQSCDGHRWQARNSGHQWTTTFAPDGFLVEPDGGGWRWGLALKSYGFGHLKTAVSGDPEIGLDGHHLTYRWDGTIREWFLNDSRGLEHGFVIGERPASTVGGELELLMEIRGGLQPVISGDGCGVDLRHENGISAVTYTGLKVWDADGKILSARFEDAGGQTIRLLVDERDARYPITIDPIAQQAYLKASNTGYSDRFGYAVAIDGDTVVVGAPYENSSATGVNGKQADNSASWSGAVYVFVRSGACGRSRPI